MADIILHSHSELGPSAAERWMGCLGSTLAIRGVDKPPTEYSAEGVFAHTVSEWAREQNVPVASFKGREVEVDGFKFKVTKAVAEHIQTFVDSCTEVPGVPVVEGRVAYEELVAGGFGTLDDARIRDGVAVVTDLKFGRGVQVFAKDNPQLKLYALGLFFTYGWMFDFNKFVLRVSQPRLHHFEEAEISLGHLLQWGYDAVRPAAILARTPGQPLKAGSHCKFCPIKDTCAVRAAYKIGFERSPDRPEDAFVNLEL
jgi:hypothetical protein